MGELSYTTGGDSNLVSFKSTARVPITSLKTYFKPKQNLHGYSKPWIGGTGKNLLQNTRTPMTYSTGGITFTTCSDGRMIIDGTAERSAVLILNNSLTLPTGSYILSGCPSDGSINHFSLVTYNGIDTEDTGSSATFTLSESTTFKVRIEWEANASFNNSIFYPMIRLASNNDATWEPYENICPIEGWQGVEVYQNDVYSPNEYQKIIPITFPGIGKNLLNPSQAITGTGMNSILFGREPSDSKGTIFLPAGTYTFSSNVQADIISITNSKKININGIQQNTNTYTFTLGTDDYIGIMFYKNETSSEDFLTYQYQLEVGDTATTYEPFDNTVYGGYVDIAAGEVVEEYSGNRELNSASMTFRNSTYDRFGGGRGFKMDSNTATLTDAVFCDSLPIRQDLDSEDFPYMLTLIQKVQDISYLYYIVVLGKLSEHPELTDASTTLTYCNEWLSEHNISVRWKKAPLTYKIPPTQLNTLLDFNTFYSNTNGNTEVSYQIHDSAPIRATKHRIAANEPHIETIENSLAQFKTDMIAPLKECKVHFEPIQSGGGNASPENIRGIYGWNGCELYRTGKNLCNVQFEQGTINGNTSEELESSKKIRSGFVNLKVGRKYTIYVNSNSSTIRLSRIYTYNNNNMVTSYSGILNASFPYSVNPYGASNDGINYNDTSSSIKMRLLLGNSDSSIISPSDVSSVMIQLFGEDATYEPYIGTTLPIAFPSEAGTIYGGYIDLIRGEIVEEWQAFDMTQLNLTQFSTGTSISIISAFPGTIKSRNKMYCNILTPMANPNISDTEGIDWNNNRINICLSASRELDSQEKIEQWLNDLKNNGTTPLIVANMATPITYSIDPLILKTLRGQNNIWSNSNGPIDIKYWTH